MANRRDVSPFLQMVRDFFLKRKNVNLLRFREDIAPRTQPPPNLPQGPHAKLNTNYYYTRDARRLVKPDLVLVEGKKMLELPEGGGKPTTVLNRVPGKVHNWDQ